jgi:hypothetical protein
MAPAGARGRAPTRKQTKKKKKPSPDQPVRDSPYELQRKEMIARNAECLGTLAIEGLPARAKATKRRQRSRCAHVKLRSFAGASMACLGAQIAA